MVIVFLVCGKPMSHREAFLVLFGWGSVGFSDFCSLCLQKVLAVDQFFELCWIELDFVVDRAGRAGIGRPAENHRLVLVGHCCAEDVCGLQ